MPLEISGSRPSPTPILALDRRESASASGGIYRGGHVRITLSVPTSYACTPCYASVHSLSQFPELQSRWLSDRLQIEVRHYCQQSGFGFAQHYGMRGLKTKADRSRSSRTGSLKLCANLRQPTMPVFNYR